MGKGSAKSHGGAHKQQARLTPRLGAGKVLPALKTGVKFSSGKNLVSKVMKPLIKRAATQPGKSMTRPIFATTPKPMRLLSSGQPQGNPRMLVKPKQQQQQVVKPKQQQGGVQQHQRVLKPLNMTKNFGGNTANRVVKNAVVSSGKPMKLLSQFGKPHMKPLSVHRHMKPLNLHTKPQGTKVNVKPLHAQSVTGGNKPKTVLKTVKSGVKPAILVPNKQRTLIPNQNGQNRLAFRTSSVQKNVVNRGPVLRSTPNPNRHISNLKQVPGHFAPRTVVLSKPGGGKVSPFGRNNEGASHGGKGHQQHKALHHQKQQQQQQQPQQHHQHTPRTPSNNSKGSHKGSSNKGLQPSNTLVLRKPSFHTNSKPQHSFAPQQQQQQQQRHKQQHNKQHQQQQQKTFVHQRQQNKPVHQQFVPQQRHKQQQQQQLSAPRVITHLGAGLGAGNNKSKGHGNNKGAGKGHFNKGHMKQRKF